MQSPYIRRGVYPIAAAILMASSLLGAQEQLPEPSLKSYIRGDRQHDRSTPTAAMNLASAFARLRSDQARSELIKPDQSNRPLLHAQSLGSRVKAAAAPVLLSFGTGGGDINEVEPNGSVAQGVSLPVNIFGRISFDGDVDFFAFQALAGQQVVIEPFAARVRNSLLIADIALFSSSGDLIASAAGSEFTDPLIRYRSEADQTLIAGITDLDSFGGPNFDYLLNITTGDDVDEEEPNDRSPQQLPSVPATIFGQISGTQDVDFYSFVAEAGQTLILDVDAEVLGSRLDAEMNLSDPETGVEFFYNDQSEGDDPRFNIVLPYTGRYVIGVGAFAGNSDGFYRLNVSLVPSSGAPIITSLNRISKKRIEVTGTGLSERSNVEVNGVKRKTSLLAPGVLGAKAKTKPGKVVTVSNKPDDRRSNPLVVQ